MRTIVWFRGKDLRLSDHEPLQWALKGGDVIPLFVLDPYFFDPVYAQGMRNRIQFLLSSLQALRTALKKAGSDLLIVPGRSVDEVPRVCEQWNADRVVAYRWVAPLGRERDRRVKERLGERFELFDGETLCPPETIRNGKGLPYSVFTPFYRAFRRQVRVGAPQAAPLRLPPLPAELHRFIRTTPTCEDLGITENPMLLKGGEEEAQVRMRRFLREVAALYDVQRDRMDLAGTSRLSVDLKFGTLSARQVWHTISEALGPVDRAEPFLRQLVWREFTHSTLWDRPDVLYKPFRKEFEGFPWRSDPAGWEAWRAGATGYPVVDAAAKQLLSEGFVHNRARMVAASFLTKHLLIDYRRGEAHYMAHLTDGDWAQNNAGWQWSAGCGCDAQPYFRVFNPVRQGERFDPDGGYVRRWLPELSRLPSRWIHRPWEAPPEVLSDAGVTLGVQYPVPVVVHAVARARYLQAAVGHLKRPARDDVGSALAERS